MVSNINPTGNKIGYNTIFWKNSITSVYSANHLSFIKFITYFKFSIKILLKFIFKKLRKRDYNFKLLNCKVNVFGFKYSNTTFSISLKDYSYLSIFRRRKKFILRRVNSILRRFFRRIRKQKFKLNKLSRALFRYTKKKKKYFNQRKRGLRFINNREKYFVSKRRAILKLKFLYLKLRRAGTQTKNINLKKLKYLKKKILKLRKKILKNSLISSSNRDLLNDLLLLKNRGIKFKLRKFYKKKKRRLKLIRKILSQKYYNLRRMGMFFFLKKRKLKKFKNPRFNLNSFFFLKRLGKTYRSKNNTKPDVLRLNRLKLSIIGLVLKRLNFAFSIRYKFFSIFFGILVKKLLVKYFVNLFKFIPYNMNLRFSFINNKTRIIDIDAKYIVNYLRSKMLEMEKISINSIIESLKESLKDNKKIKGYKVCFSGRFTRRQIATYSWDSFGKIPINDQSSVVDFAFTKLITQHGLCGIKLWLHR